MTAGHARLQDAGLLDRDLCQRVAQELLVVHVHRRDHRDRRAGRSRWWHPAAAKPHFQQQVVGRMAREGQHGGRRGDLEKGDRLAAIGLLAFLQQRPPAPASGISSPPPGAPSRMRS